MDPLSICVSTATLAELSIRIGKTLCDFTKYAINADSHIQGLTQELSMLTGSLTSIDKTLSRFKSQSPRSRARLLADEQVYHQSRLALRNCETTLLQLRDFVDGITKKMTVSGASRLWKFKTAVDLTTHKSRLVGFREKMGRSNAALQTMLHTLVVSLSLQSNQSQKRIVADLKRLNASIDRVQQLSIQRASHSLERQDEDEDEDDDLRYLAQAARNFHSAASSTAASVQGEEAGSVASHRLDVTSLRQRRLHDFVYCGLKSSGSCSSSVNMTEEVASAEGEEQLHDRLDRHDYTGLMSQMPLVQVLEDFALARMKTRKFLQAANFLEQAITKKQQQQHQHQHQQEQQDTVDEDDNAILTRLRTRLALCHLFQRDRPSVVTMVNMLSDDGTPSLEVCNLMHALALTYLSEYAFDAAESWCKRALESKQKLLGMDHVQTVETLGLLASIYKMSDDLVMKEVIRRMMPVDFEYCHPRDELAFIARHTLLLPPELSSSSHLVIPTVVVVELDASSTASTCVENQVNTALSRGEKLDLDTSKEVVVVVDDPEKSVPVFLEPIEVDKRGQGSDIKSRLAQMLRTGSIRRAISDPRPMEKASSSSGDMRGWLRSRGKSVLSKSKSLSRHARFSTSVRRRSSLSDDNDGFDVDDDEDDGAYMEALDDWMAKSSRKAGRRHGLSALHDDDDGQQPSELMELPVFEAKKDSSEGGNVADEVGLFDNDENEDIRAGLDETHTSINQTMAAISNESLIPFPPESSSQAQDPLGSESLEQAKKVVIALVCAMAMVSSIHGYEE
ncbi:hypothetical protein CP532_1767 [Ophiocordyceps camponoti-leonardi (nom. inval.)]|nr:hypothetical protein CP532_1767 [Ophiocordyceps camponoti-leonardi (nom. inval.)]